LIKYDTKTYKKLFDTVLNSKSNIDASEMNKNKPEVLDLFGAAAQAGNIAANMLSQNVPLSINNILHMNMNMNYNSISN